MKRTANLRHIKVKVRGVVFSGAALSGRGSSPLPRAGVPLALICREEGDVESWQPRMSPEGTPSPVRSPPSFHLAPLVAQSRPPGHRHGEPDPQRDAGLFVRCDRRPDPQPAGLSLPRGCARRHLYPQPGLGLGQEPGRHLVCQILGP